MTDTVLDTASTNAVVFDGGTFGTIDAVPESGSFDTSLDHDWLAVSLIAGHDYVFSGMAVSDTLNDVAIDLRDSSRTILNSQGVVDAGPNLTSRFTYTATSSGTAYLAISAGGNNPASQTGQYFVTCADAGVDTVLDTASTNASLTMGATTSGRINGVPESGSFDTSLDHDWFAVSLVAGHTYIFSAQGTSGGLNDVAIDLRDSSRTILDGQGVVDAGANATSSFAYTATSSGTEYLAISAGGNNPAGLSGDYQITVTEGFGGDTVLDTASTNAVVFAGGTFGRIDAVPESGSFDTSLDHDWLAVSLIAGHDYTFSGSGISDSLNDVAIDLRDSNRNILNSQGVVDAGPNIISSFTYTATSSGTEYLAISAGGNNPASQTGQYFVTYADAGADTVLDTASTNASLTMGGTTSGRIDGVPESGSFDTSLDHDWFAVSLVAGHSYTFSGTAVRGSGNLNDVAIDLRDSSRIILDSQGVVDGGPNAASSFFYTATSSGTEYLAISAGGNNPAGLTGDYQITVTDNGLAPPPGLTINLIYDANALAAPQSFRDGMQAAANMLEGAFNDNIEINIAVGYGEFGGVTLSNQNVSEGNIGYTGDGTSGQGISENYSNLRTLLLNHEGSADDITSVNSLPNTPSLQGNSSFVIGAAQAKALGVISAAGVAVDGQVGMGTGFTGNGLLAAALHEITHAMGRIAGLSLDLFRFNEDRSGSRVFGFAKPATPAYFSIDGGATDLADFGINSDPGDFLNGGVQGPDPFNEFLGGASSLTPTDLRIMDVLGFHLGRDTTAPVLVSDNPLVVPVGRSQTISSSRLRFDDDVSSHAQEVYTVVTAPAHGSLLRNGSATSTFTQADIDNGSIAYQEDGSKASSDTFIFKVSDVAGNTTVNEAFHLQIGSSVPDDLNGDATSDVLLYHAPTGQVGEWLMQNGQLSQGQSFGTLGVGSGWSIVGSGDFNGDHTTDVLLYNSNTSQLGEWLMQNGQLSQGKGFGTLGAGSGWTPAGTGDFNGDGTTDVLLYNSNNTQVGVWLMQNGQLSQGQSFGTLGAGSGWAIAGTGDLNGDGTTDVLLYNSNTSQVGEWLMQNGQLSQGQAFGTLGVSSGWSIAGTGDFNGDGTTDVLLYNSNTSQVGEWLMQNGQLTVGANIGALGVGSGWSIAGTGDFNGDGTTDTLLHNSINTQVGEWLMQNGQLAQGQGFGTLGAGSGWQLKQV